MSNYHATARSNYFKVKDLEAFNNWCRSLEIEPIDGDPGDNKAGLVAMISDTPDGDGWPSSRVNENDEAVEVDLAAELSAHLEDGWVAVLMESGAEKCRYVSGWALAVNSKGETRHLSLQDIYELARQLREHVTEAEY
jgi:hypothetical protein